MSLKMQAGLWRLAQGCIEAAYIWDQVQNIMTGTEIHFSVLPCSIQEVVSAGTQPLCVARF